MPIWLAIMAQAAGGPSSTRPIELPRLVPSCEREASSDTIVVCGERSNRFRLPLPIDPVDGDTHVPASAVAAITPHGDCGLFAGQHACSKREAAKYGYGNGRNPVTLLRKLGQKLADPDADLGTPDPVP